MLLCKHTFLIKLFFLEWKKKIEKKARQNSQMTFGLLWILIGFSSLVFSLKEQKIRKEFYKNVGKNYRKVNQQNDGFSVEWVRVKTVNIKWYIISIGTSPAAISHNNFFVE